MAAKRTSGNASEAAGCGIIIGFIFLILTFGWPLLVFHRHWTTYRTVNCSTDQLADGCTFDWNSGQMVGTGTEATTHSAISATGYIVEVVWLLLIVGGLILLGTVSAKKRRATSAGAGNPRAGYDVTEPSLSTNRSKPEQVVLIAALDESCRQLLIRTQRAINDVLTCKVYADNKFQQAVTEPTLRRHEWVIAVNLREITNLRSEQARMRKSRGVDSPGPLTKAVLEAQQGALKQKLKTVESLIEALENYAVHVKTADLARLDWEAAAELAKLNPRFSDLVAGTAADELHLQEVHDMTDEASTFRETLLRANLAAEPLLLPDVIADPDEKS